MQWWPLCQWSTGFMQRKLKKQGPSERCLKHEVTMHGPCMRVPRPKSSFPPECIEALSWMPISLLNPAHFGHLKRYQVRNILSSPHEFVQCRAMTKIKPLHSSWQWRKTSKAATHFFKKKTKGSGGREWMEGWRRGRSSLWEMANCDPDKWTLAEMFTKLKLFGDPLKNSHH